MRALLLSDIHGNLEALTAVLDAAGQWDALWNLGDMVGYGASPNQVVEVIRPLATLTVRGNHDRICCGLTSARNFNPMARASAKWTMQELSAENLEWLRGLPQGPLQPERRSEDEVRVTLAHGSPLNEDHYIQNMRDAWAPLQQMSTPIAFVGHTHIQGGFTLRDDQVVVQHLKPAAGNLFTSLPLEKGTSYLLNPGSVGQPRDGDPRAAFAIADLDHQSVEFWRIPYDIEAVQNRMTQAGLPEPLILRLSFGR